MIRRSSQGFTIIEVLIVLAIAGLLMIIVFQAVPALRRNSRNSARDKDASLILTQRLQYNADIKTTMSAGTFRCEPPLNPKIFCGYIEGALTFYELDNVIFTNSGLSPPSPIPTITNPDEVLTITHLRCNESGTAAEVATSPTNMVVLYAVETGNGTSQTQCLESFVLPTI